jgi:hypothetical protein
MSSHDKMTLKLECGKDLPQEVSVAMDETGLRGFVVDHEVLGAAWMHVLTLPGHWETVNDLLIEFEVFFDALDELKIAWEVWNGRGGLRSSAATGMSFPFQVLDDVGSRGLAVEQLVRLVEVADSDADLGVRLRRMLEEITPDPEAVRKAVLERWHRERRIALGESPRPSKLPWA